MDAHLASAGGFDLVDAAKIGGRHWCDEFYKSHAAAPLALPSVGGHQQPFQLPAVQVQLLCGPVYTFVTSNVDSHCPQLFRDRCLNRAGLSPVLKSRSSDLNTFGVVDV